MKSIKLCVVGDDGVGKSTLLRAFCQAVSRDEPPATFENHVVPWTVDGHSVSLSLFEIEKNESNPGLRLAVYPSTDVFILVFSVIQPPSFENVTLNFEHELKAHCAKVPVILCGNKTDMRGDPETVAALKGRHLSPPITTEQGQSKAKTLGPGSSYLETCATTRAGVIQAFEAAVRAVISPPELPKAEPSSCHCAVL